MPPPKPPPTALFTTPLKPPLNRTALRTRPLPPITFTPRTLSSTPALQLSKDKTPPPPSNMPPNAQKAGKPNIPAEDSQSSASTQSREKQSGDDHPAKQPDPQSEVDRSTGFGNVEGAVTGGKEGLGARSDRGGDGK